MDLFQTNLMAMGFFNMKEEELLDQFSHEYCSCSELCVPQDKLQDLKFLFVNNDLIISFNNHLISGFNNDSISSLNNDSISSSEISVTQEEDDSSNVESRIVDEKSSKCEYYSSEKETIRRCRHCETQKTPQWRMGPLGRKTLCNACGVRYRAGKLLPEYRPAASPTFDGSKHSNFHKRIMRKKKKKNYEEEEGYSNLHKRVLRRKKENYEEEEEEGGFLQLVRPYIGYA